MSFNGMLVRKPVSPRLRRWLVYLSFGVPLAVWALVSYVPFLWHPLVEVSDPGSVAYLSSGSLVDKEVFGQEQAAAIAEGRQPPVGTPANPIYFPPPHRVAVSLFTAFTAEPRLSGEPWFHQSVGQSIRVIFWGFVLSSVLAVPLGLLAGTYRVVAHIVEPFVEFFRYLPAPAFGALAVAILGIANEPKIAIIFIGTFFQQVLIVSASTQRLDMTIIESAQTLGASRASLLFKVIVPGVAVDLYRDMRILLGWAWTYLIVAEVVGTSTGITWFINQQARYRIYDKVYAAILIIGVIGLTTDSLLAWLGRRLFPWYRHDEAR